MEEIQYNATNPYNLTFALHPSYEKYGPVFMAHEYNAYGDKPIIASLLIFKHLKNVSRTFVPYQEMMRRMFAANIKSWTSTMPIEQSIASGVIDSTALFFNVVRTRQPQVCHIYTIRLQRHPIDYKIGPEKGSFGGVVHRGTASLRLGISRLLAADRLRLGAWLTSSTRKIRCTLGWQDLLNNCVTGVVRPGPVSSIRAFWLLAVFFLIQLWTASFKSHLLLEKGAVYDSFEDVLLNPRLMVMLVEQTYMKNLILEGDPKYKRLQKLINRQIPSRRRP